MSRYCLPVIAVLTTLALLGGCSAKKTELAVAPPPPATADHPSGETAASPAPEVHSTSVPTPAAVTLSTLDGSNLETVYFDYDSFTLQPPARQALERNAAWLQANPAVKVTIEGHCDERGSDEYNLALGERRAMAVRNYLTTLGVDRERLTTISYGEERPAVAGHDEAAWARNRRGEFK